MNERRKIVIQTGSDADDSLSTPHFDTEATLTARPVVPLAEGVAGQAYDPRRLRAGKSRNPWLLILIVLGAVGLGVATGLTIGFYKNRQASAPPVASESSAPAPDVNSAKTVEPPAPTPLPTPEEEARASVPEVAEESPVQPKDEEPERAARDERDDRDDRRATRPVVPENRRERDEEVADDDDAERRAERQRRREERRERRRRDRDLEQPAEFPRDIERAGREQINRIRDIFEGRQP